MVMARQKNPGLAAILFFFWCGLGCALIAVAFAAG
jgi:hypothetical protein